MLGMGLLCAALFFMMRRPMVDSSASSETSKGGSSQANRGTESQISTGVRNHQRGKAGASSSEAKEDEMGIGLDGRLLVPGFLNVPDDAIRKALKANPEDASVVASSILWTKDKAIQENAKAMSEKSPMVTAALAVNASNSADRTLYAERLIEQSPQNSLGYLIKADELIRSGNTDEAKELLSRITPEMRIDFFRADLAAGQRTILEASGYNKKQVGMLCAQDEWAEKSSQFMGRMIARGLADSDAQFRAEFASLAINSLDQIREDMGTKSSFSDEIGFLNLQEVTLRRLPEDFMMADGSETVAEHAEKLGELTRKKAELAGKAREMLDRSNQEIVTKYYTTLMEDGEEAAAEWLLGKDAVRR